MRLRRSHKKWIMVLADCFMVPFALWAALALRMGDFWPSRLVTQFWWLFPSIIPIAVFTFARLGLYRAIVRFIGSKALWAIVQGSIFMALVLWSIVFLSREPGFPRSIPILFAMVLLAFVGGSRLWVRWLFQWINSNFVGKEPVAIYGAGQSGMELVTALQKGNQFIPVAFFDDNPQLWKHSVQGIRVYSPEYVAEALQELKVKRVLLAVPQATKKERKRILDRLEPYPVHVQTIPAFPDLIAGKAAFDQLQEVELEDLLGRDPVPPKQELFEKCIKDKTVLVTGGGGSIGSELCRQILSARPACLIVYEQSEYALYSIEQELSGLIKAVGIDTELIPLLGSVCNEARIQATFQRYSPQTVYHAAAYKHVPIVEHNVFEGVRNNVIGTKVVAEAAHIFGCEHFVFVSTDKAVRPTNVMGATKRFAEQVVQQLALHSKTVFSMVRFGNVLGSSGSVIPLFRSQIATGGPVTVTHPDITRFFMTIPEAAQLVIQAGAMAEGGDVFVLDMGAPVKIVDLATRMIELSGFEVSSEETNEGDIAIQYTGLRPGEKLYEELLIGENVTGTVHPKIMRANETYVDSALIIETLGSLAVAELSLNSTLARSVLQKVVSEFQPSSPDRDFLAKKFISFPIDDGTTLN
ncbi:MAG: nucleoside-diphosphate sugar epimerase/dehydratase [Reinekea sp.]